MTTLVLSPVRPFAERPRATPRPFDDRVRQLAARLPRAPQAWRRHGLRAYVREADAQADWAEAAAADLPAACQALAIALRAHGFGPAAVGPAFALLRTLGHRLLGTRAFDVQLMGAAAMLQGRLAEMATGEGKTLTAAIAAAVAALAGNPVHVVTVNDYLARRDAEHLGPLYAALGLTTGLVVHGMGPEARRTAYGCDVVYASNKELTFDYLRDQIVRRSLPTPLHLRIGRLAGTASPVSRLVMRGLHFAIVDEADSVLIDEARTPLIISETARGELVGDADGLTAASALEVAAQLVPDADYTLDLGARHVELTGPGANRVAELTAPFGGDWTVAFIREELIGKALSALHLFRREEHYLARGGKVQIIDEYTGRIMEDRFWSEGLHQMIEVKEGCAPSPRKDTIARITYQRFFTRYRHLCGMSGTLAEVARELRAVYGLGVARIPTNRPPQRMTLPARVLPDLDAKWRAVAEETRTLVAAGRPVLIGTRTVAASLRASQALGAAGLPHALLNADQDAREAETVAEAGRASRVTIATNMAGRGTDIRLDPGIAERGGLAVVLTERHEAGRIDRQLAGRCGRQGDPGSVHPILSLEDPLFEGMRQTLVGRTLLAAAARHRTLALLLFHLRQRQAERSHEQVRHALLRLDTRLSEALSFSGRPE